MLSSLFENKYYKISFLCLLTTVLCGSIFAQVPRPITVDQIWKGYFFPERIISGHSMKDGKHYLRINRDYNEKQTTLDKYAFKSLKKVSTLVKTSYLPQNIDFQNYILNDAETKLLLETQSTPIYRHSSKGIYYLYDIATKKANPIFNKKIQEPTFSPNGGNIAFVFENNIYIRNTSTGKLTQVTKDGKKNKIINGISDWVYEEEFAFVRAYHWNPTGDKIAFIKFDESQVPDFSMDVYSNGLYPKEETFKYPKAGENNSKVSLYIYTLKTQSISKVPLEAYYIPRIKWTNYPDILSIQTLNRHQNNLQLLAYNTASKKMSTLLNEKNNTYIDIKDDLSFLSNGSFLWTSEKSGYNHIYLYSNTGKLIRQITKGRWDVTKLYGYNQKDRTLYYQSTERGSIYRDIYRVRINGRNKKQLSSSKKGTNNADFSADMSYYTNNFSSARQPPQYTLNQSDGKKLKDIITNEKYRKKIEAFQLPKKEYTTININGNELNMWMIKPKSFDTSKEYPLFMTQYSGPNSQQVSDKWMTPNDFWYMMLSQQGYVVVCVDGRGTGFKGADFKKVTYKQLGKYEVEDQISVAKKLGKLEYIDASRIGIWGWSYGGFMSTNCILKGNDVFKMAIAVAPVTSWRFYDTIYTERYMQTPQENPQGYDENSPISYPEKLKGKFLLIHGTADDNVHFQNTMRMVEGLVQANKQFDWAVYPDKNHGISGGYTRSNLYTKMTNFIKNNL